jgi:hypothetical protein
LRPQAEAARQQQLFVSLPNDIKAFAEAVDFDPLDATGHGGIEGDLDRELRPQIEVIKVGEWYLYDDKKEAEEKIARIIVTINNPSSGRLVFTNQNRSKVRHMTYMGLAYRLPTGSVKTLELSTPVRKIAGAHLNQIIDTIKAQKARELRKKQVEQRKQISKQFLAQQKTLLRDENLRLNQRAALPVSYLI